MNGNVYFNASRNKKKNSLLKAECIDGREGIGFTHVLPATLDFGRYSVAWGCVGIAQACLESCLEYASERKQFGSYLKDHQLIRRMITDMIANIKAARLLCYQPRPGS